MCVVSMVMDYGRERIGPNQWDLESIRLYFELIEAAKKFDKAAKEPDCEDPQKARIIDDLKRRVAALEAAQSKSKPRRKART